MSAAEEAQDLASVVGRYVALLATTDLVASYQELPLLLQHLALRLQPVVSLEFIQIRLYERDRLASRLQWTAAGDAPLHKVDFATEEAAAAEVFRTQKPLDIPDITRDARFGVSHNSLTDVRSLYVFPLTTQNCSLGTVCFASMKEDGCDKGACELLTRVAQLLAIAAERVIARQKTDEYQDKLALQRGRFHLLMEINKLFFRELDPQGLFAAVSRSIHRLLRHDYAFLVLQDSGTNQFRLHAMDCPPGTEFLQPGRAFPVGPSLTQASLETRQPLVLNGDEIVAFPGELPRRAYEEGIRSICCVPLLIGDRGLGSLCIASLQPNAFTEEDVELLWHIGEQVALALENAFAFGQVSELIEKLAGETLS